MVTDNDVPMMSYNETMSNFIVVTRNGKTFFRRKPDMPKKVYETEGQRRRLVLFRMLQGHLKHHRKFIKLCFEKGTKETAAGNYQSLNYEALKEALSTLIDRELADGYKANYMEVEQAIIDFARQHPERILVGHMKGKKDVYLKGEWPAEIVFEAIE